MATKKEVTTGEQHEELIQAIVDAEKSLVAAKEVYKVFCKANPLEAQAQLTPHELRKMTEKLGKPTEADHAKANAAAAQAVAKQALINQAKGE
jgi:hypothetical protein